MSAVPQVHSPPDADLVAAYRGGDDHAATALVARHAPAVGRYLYASGAEEAEVEDLVQETMFRAFRGLVGWRGDGSFRGWLFTIAGNLLRDERRRRRGRLLVPLDDRDHPVGAGPDAELAAADTEEQVRRGIARLPRLQREVFLRRVQEGRDYADIARELGTTPGAARVHYHNAVRRLKDLIR